MTAKATRDVQLKKSKTARPHPRRTAPASWTVAVGVWMLVLAPALVVSCNAPDPYDPWLGGSEECEDQSECSGSYTCVPVASTRKCLCVAGENGAECSGNKDCDNGTCQSDCTCYASPSGSGGSGSGASGSGGGGMGGIGGMGGTAMGECSHACVDDSDCYTPNEEACKNGVCVNDCLVKGCSSSDYTCVELGGGITDCLRACAIDTDCDPDGFSLCAGVGEDGTQFCAEADGGVCSSDTDCVGSYYGSACNPSTGVCGCAADADCSHEPYETVCGNK